MLQPNRDLVLYLHKLLLLVVFLSGPRALLANDIEKKLIESGLVDVNTIDRSIRVDLVN